MKKFVNDPKQFVPEMLKGIALAGVQCLAAGRGCRGLQGQTRRCARHSARLDLMQGALDAQFLVAGSRHLLGMLRADAGSAALLGGDPWKDGVALHARLAYVPGDVSLWPGLSGGQAIDLLGNLRGGLDRRRRDRLIERFELDPTKRGRQYSKGNRQKVAIVAALAAKRAEGAGVSVQ